MTQQDTQPPAETLAECPFCGGAAELKGANAPEYWVACPGFGCKASTEGFGSKDRAIAAWNRRAALTRRAGGDAGCKAAPDHADIMETIQNAADDWQKKGYATALAEVRDMANVGRALMEALPEGHSYNDCPSEIVSDLQNELDEALARAGGGAIPAGWQLVPPLPTAAMLDAAEASMVNSAGIVRAYEAMLAAVPTLPTPRPSAGGDAVDDRALNTKSVDDRETAFDVTQTADAIPAGEVHGKWHKMLLALVNAIHRDGGEKTQAIGIDLSYRQALAIAATPKPPAGGDAGAVEDSINAVLERWDAHSGDVDERKRLIARLLASFSAEGK